MYLFTVFVKNVHDVVSFKLRWCRVRDLFGSQIPVTTGGFELRISRIQSRYLIQSSEKINFCILQCFITNFGINKLLNSNIWQQICYIKIFLNRN